MFCTNCGIKIPSKGSFCMNCGQKAYKASKHIRSMLGTSSRRSQVPWLIVLPIAVVVIAAAVSLTIALSDFTLPDEAQPAVMLPPISGTDYFEDAVVQAYDPHSPATGNIPFDISVSAGDYTWFGGHIWRVLEVAGYRALIITESIIMSRGFHTASGAVTWETSEIRHFLNGEFLNSFSPIDQELIAETFVTNTGSPWFGTNGGQDTIDKIFLLSIDEVVRFFGDSGLMTKGINENERGWGLMSYGIHGWGIHDQFSESRIARDLGGVDAWWWLRSPGSMPDHAAIVMGDNGSLNMYGNQAFVLEERGSGIRPAMWLDARNLHKIETYPAEQAEPVPIAAPDRRDDLLGVWRGTYYSGRGIMGREMAVFRDGNDFVAKVWFFPTVGSPPDRPSGSVLSEVFFNTGTNEFVITNSTWVDQPPGMGLFDRGDLVLEGNTLTGVHDNRADRPINMSRIEFSNFILNHNHSHIAGQNHRTIIEASGTNPELRVYYCIFCHIEILHEVHP